MILGFPDNQKIGGHSCIGNSGAVLRRSFTAAIPAVITPGSHSSLIVSRAMRTSLLLVYFQNYCTKEDNGVEMMAAKFLPFHVLSSSAPILFVNRHGIQMYGVLSFKK